MSWFVIERDRRASEEGPSGSGVVWLSHPLHDQETAETLATDLNNESEDPVLAFYQSPLMRFTVHRIERKEKI